LGVKPGFSSGSRQGVRGSPFPVDDACALVLKDLELDEGVVAGEIREHSVGVLRYRGAPAEDCEYLLERLCKWLDDDLTTNDETLSYSVAVLRAIMAHLYIAWIHPFGDGNGRTARLIEFQLLVRAGIPFPAAHLLSDHYNRTRSAYYRELDRTSKEPYLIERFIDYAMQGFVDELRSQIDDIRQQQMLVTWEHYVHSKFAERETKARTRQKHLVLALPADRATPIGGIRSLSPRLAEGYSGKQNKTITRDVNALLRDNLITKGSHGILPRQEIVRAFLPGRAP
jgi:fido (protein-threonine AMPylation protein)